MAFLIVEEEYEPAKQTQTSNNDQASTPASSNQYKPQTPSAECQPEHFPLLNLPLELRDRVYYYYLCQPNGFRLKRSRAITRSDRWRTPKELSAMPLFLTSKQIYQEALRIFCRYNVIEVTTRGTRKGWSLPGSLRLFPDKHARLMQRVSRSYDTSTRLLGYPGFIPRSRETHPVGKQWVDMIHEACCLKDYFPMLREFTVRWNVHPDAFRERDGLLFNDKKKEQKVVVWLKWMRFWAKACNARPVPWMRFEFHTLYYNSQNPMAMHEDELNEAYQILCEELRVPECGVVRIEDSGRKWLEEAWTEGAAARRKRKKDKS